MTEVAELERATPVRKGKRKIHIAVQRDGYPQNLVALCGQKLSFTYTPRSGERAGCEVCNLLAEAIDWSGNG